MRISSTLAAGAALLLLAACSSTAGRGWLHGDQELADCPAPKAILDGELEPIYETREEPVYEEIRTKIYGEKTVPVYRHRRVPVTLKAPNLCTGCDDVVELWDRKVPVQVGVRRVRTCLGYHTRRVQVGSCEKREIVGWRPATDEPDCLAQPACPATSYVPAGY